MSDPCPTCGHTQPPPAPGPIIYPGRVMIKTAADAPSIGVGIPSRGSWSCEFSLFLNQLLQPLNTKISYIIQKGKLPAEARNSILEGALAYGVETVFFLDDDVFFPDMTLYRLWGSLQKHPEAAVITGIYPTKVPPVEPLLYRDNGDGAYWDWPLGVLTPVHSAGAGCFIVRMEYVKKLSPPWFNDVVKDSSLPDEAGARKRSHWGHDRYFMMRLRDEAGGQIYADTGLLLAHFDEKLQHVYTLPPDSPCFQREPLGESWVATLNEQGQLYWKRLLPLHEGDQQFVGYLDWVRSLAAPHMEQQIAIL